MANTRTPAPTTREYSILQLVAELEKEELKKPDVAYVFSSGTVKFSTDHTDSGIYER